MVATTWQTATIAPAVSIEVTEPGRRTVIVGDHLAPEQVQRELHRIGAEAPALVLASLIGGDL